MCVCAQVFKHPSVIEIYLYPCLPILPRSSLRGWKENSLLLWTVWMGKDSIPKYNKGKQGSVDWWLCWLSDLPDRSELPLHIVIFFFSRLWRRYFRPVLNTKRLEGLLHLRAKTQTLLSTLWSGSRFKMHCLVEEGRHLPWRQHTISRNKLF